LNVIRRGRIKRLVSAVPKVRADRLEEPLRACDTPDRLERERKAKATKRK
jgi:hypothetical protein